MNSGSYYQMVEDFHDKHGLIAGQKLNVNEYRQTILFRSKLIAEECHELVESLYNLDQRGMKKEDLMHVAKEICDVMYVAIGTAVAFNIDIDNAFKEVHRSNMSKEVAAKVGGKVQKGLSYVPANLTEAVKNAHLPTQCQQALRQESP